MKPSIAAAADKVFWFSLRRKPRLAFRNIGIVMETELKPRSAENRTEEYGMDSDTFKSTPISADA